MNRGNLDTDTWTEDRGLEYILISQRMQKIVCKLPDTRKKQDKLQRGRNLADLDFRLLASRTVRQ